MNCAATATCYCFIKGPRDVFLDAIIDLEAQDERDLQHYLKDADEAPPIQCGTAFCDLNWDHSGCCPDS
jgi:hypothetical protein